MQQIQNSLIKKTNTNRIDSCAQIFFTPVSWAGAILVTLTVCLMWSFFMFPHSLNQVVMGVQNVTGDAAQHLSGWFAYRNEAWHFPLLKTTLINYPKGTTVSATDSIPLFAFVFKIFKNSLPGNFNYFGFFYIFSFISQGLATCVLLRAIGQKSIFSLICGLALCLTMPVFLARWESLHFQSLILWSFAVYFLSINQAISLKTSHVLFGLLINLSLFVHPYFLLFVYSFYLGCLWDSMRIKHLSLKQLFPAFFVVNAITVGIMLVFGFGRGVQLSGGFGIYSANLLQLVQGGHFFQFTDDMTGGQYEGYSYLGLGVIALFLVGLMVAKQDVMPSIKKYQGGFFALLFLTMYAVLPVIYLGKFQLADFSMPRILHFTNIFIKYITENFRSNGRFIWALDYAVVFFGIAAVTKKKTLALWVLPLLIVLQMYDISGNIRGAQHGFRDTFLVNPLGSQMVPLIKEAKAVVLYPKYGCKRVPDDFYAVTQMFVAKNALPINTGYIAHSVADDCNDDAQKFSALFDKVLLVAPLTDLSPTMVMIQAKYPKACVRLNADLFCLYTANPLLQEKISLV